MRKQLRKDDIVKIKPCKSTGYRTEYGMVASSEFITAAGPMVKVMGHNKALPSKLVVLQ